MLFRLSKELSERKTEKTLYADLNVIKTATIREVIYFVIYN